MNRTSIKTFATWARRTLTEQVQSRAAQFGITPGGIAAYTTVSGGLIVNGATLNADEAAQYIGLLERLTELQRTERNLAEAIDALVNEVAYTWFNRFTALRFMEVNGYIPRAIGSSDPNLKDPDLLRDATGLVQNGDLGGVSLERLDEWRRLYDAEGVYRRLLVAQCDALAVGLPFLFSPSLSYTALFLPPNLLHTESLIRHLERDITEDDWKDIEIVGWLYQFYISEEKDRVIGGKGKYPAHDIPAATQLFTPHWIVRYMVENSLGRLWLEAHPESGLRDHMPYYLESHPDNPKPDPNPTLRPEDLTVMDPACGSGHILVYAFDVLNQIYLERGYAERDIPALILAHNLHGLDIDERAAQLASFAVMMKARARNRRALREPPQLQILAVRPTRHIKLEAPALPTPQSGFFDAKPAAPQPLWTQTINPSDWKPLLDAFRDADNLGSLITPPAFDDQKLESQLRALESEGGFFADALAPELRHTLAQARLLSTQYAAVVANPPYMGSSSFNVTLKMFVEKSYPRSKSDLFAAFMERCLEFTVPKGRMATINQHSWMFLSSYEALRKNVIEQYAIQSMAHLGPRAFPEIGGEVVQSTAFVLEKRIPKDERGVYVRLVDVKDAEEKDRIFLESIDRNSRAPNATNVFYADARDFEKIPGSPIAYWISERLFSVFGLLKPLRDSADARQGLVTGYNDIFLRLWFEISFEKIGFNYSRSGALASGMKWFPYNKGGEFRRWYGNNEYIIDWENDGQRVRNFSFENGKIRSTNHNLDEIFHESFTWTDIGTNVPFALRYSAPGFLFDSSGKSLFVTSRQTAFPVFLILNSILSKTIFPVLNPSLHFQPGDVLRFPIPSNLPLELINLVAKPVLGISRADWDNFETSWDFQTHPLLRGAVNAGTPSSAQIEKRVLDGVPESQGGFSRVSDAFLDWHAKSETAFQELKRLEEENNRYWIDAYGLQDELTPEVPDDQITIRRANKARDARSLISYAVGCMMGRYSLDSPGLIHAGQTFDPGKHARYPADSDGIVPITDEAYFDDDIVARFAEFLRVAYGPDSLQENLEWIADALERKRDETALERIRRYFVVEFISDHIQVYKKRPIYWLFTSGKKRAFGALVYLHRYAPDTLARMRTEYVLEFQTKLDGALDRAGTNARDASRIRDQIAEVRAFQEKLQHTADKRIALDLDDGVAYNYTLFEGLVYEGNDLKMADLKKKSQWKRDLMAGKTGKAARGSSGVVEDDDSTDEDASA